MCLNPAQLGRGSKQPHIFQNLEHKKDLIQTDQHVKGGHVFFLIK